MDPQTLFIGLAATMAVSGGLLGGFWLRALVNMRRQVVENSRKVDELTRELQDLRHELGPGDREPTLPPDSTPLGEREG